MCCGSSTSRQLPPWRTALRRKSNETILVFDLGGGTFDVSVLEVRPRACPTLLLLTGRSFTPFPYVVYLNTGRYDCTVLN